MLIIRPAVTWVRFVCVKQNHSSISKQSKGLRLLSVMLVNFWRATFRKRVDGIINRMIGRKFNQFFIRKNSVQQWPYVFVHSIIVIHHQKATTFQITPEIIHFGIVQRNISVTGRKQKRIVKNITAADLYVIISLMQTNWKILIGKIDQVGQCRGRAVPVPAALVLNPGNFECIIRLPSIRFEHYYKQKTKQHCEYSKQNHLCG